MAWAGESRGSNNRSRAPKDLITRLSGTARIRRRGARLHPVQRGCETPRTWSNWRWRDAAKIDTPAATTSNARRRHVDEVDVMYLARRSTPAPVTPCCSRRRTARRARGPVKQTSEMRSRENRPATLPKKKAAPHEGTAFETHACSLLSESNADEQRPGQGALSQKGLGSQAQGRAPQPVRTSKLPQLHRR